MPARCWASRMLADCTSEPLLGASAFFGSPTATPDLPTPDRPDLGRPDPTPCLNIRFGTPFDSLSHQLSGISLQLAKPEGVAYSC